MLAITQVLQEDSIDLFQEFSDPDVLKIDI
jgi:hypothetical protein